MCLVSIIIPTLNSDKTIAKAIQSILVQTFQNFEIIVIDGGSTDLTISILEKFQSSYSEKIQFLSERDKGIYDAMNKGIDLAKGDWLLFLGGDDSIYNSNTLETIFANSVNNHYSFVYGNIWLEKPKRLWGGKFNSYRFIFENLPHQAVFYRKELFNRFGKYSLKYKILADKEFNLKLFTDHRIKRKYINQIVSNFSGQGISSISADLEFNKDQIPLYKEYIPRFYRLIANKRKLPLFNNIHKYLMAQNF